MAWTHFTAPLVDGQIFTAAMRAELLAALDERLKAVDANWGVKQPGDAEEDALAASGLAHRRLYYRGPASTGAYTLSDWHTVLFRLGASYLRPEQIEDATTAWGSTYLGASVNVSALLADALAELSISAAVSSVLETALETRVYWNMVREALRLLRWLDIEPGGTSDLLATVWQQRYDKFVDGSDASASGIAAAVAAFASEPETLTSGTSGLLRATLTGFSPGARWAEEYGLGGFRRVVDQSAPFVASWPRMDNWGGDWTVAMMGVSWSSFAIGVYVPVNFRFKVGGTSFEVIAPATPGDGPWQIFGAVPWVGPLVIELEFVGWSDGSLFAAMDAAVPLTGTRKDATASLLALRIAGKPTFTHP
jgi:hypothetical protein